MTRTQNKSKIALLSEFIRRIDMKKIFASIMAVAMIATMFVFTASAADNEWAVYASANAYKEEYDEDDTLPRVPGLRYVDNGVQMYTATEQQLKDMGSNAWGTIQTKEKVSYKNGLSMTVLADEFTDGAADKWISFTIWDSQKVNQGAAGYGCGWLCLIRPNAGGCDLQSFMCTPTVAMQQLILTNDNTNIYDGEALTLEIKPEDGKFNVYVNGVDMKASAFTQFMENDEAYIGVTGHQGVREQIVLTVTDFNGVKPTGTDAQEPYLPEDLQPIPDKEHTPAVPEGQPCWTWTSERVKNNKPGEDMTSIVNDDGSLKITFTENAPMLNGTIKTGTYDSAEFPIWAILYKDLDEIAGGASLWYCAGDVWAAQNDSHLSFDWSEGDYDMDNDDGWRLICVDLSDELTWEGDIHSYRLDIAGDGSLAEQTADIKWIGFFRNEKDAYNYADMGAYYEKEYGTPDSTSESAPATQPDDTTKADDTQTTTEEEGKTTTAEPAATTNKPAEQGKKSNTGMIIGIVAGVVVVAAAAACGIILSKKKKK